MSIVKSNTHIKLHLQKRDKHYTQIVSTSLFFFAFSQVDLGFLRYVLAIGTQGAISKESKKAYYVKSYKVSISTNGEDWILVKDGMKHKVLDA